MLILDKCTICARVIVECIQRLSRSGRLLGFQVLGWLHAIEAFQKTGNPLPVNLKFCFEGMEESGSEGLDELLVSTIT